MALFRYYATDAELDAASAALWEAYLVAERIRRGLPPETPIETPGTTNYVAPVRIEGQAGGVLTLDDWAQTVITDGVALTELSEPWRSHIQAMYDV